MNYREAELWKRTLGAHLQGPEEEARKRLESAFVDFRRLVEPLAAEIALSVPGYTDHSIVHCDALWDTAGLIAGPDYPLNPLEAFLLGGSFLIHDLGMGLAAHSGGLGGILREAKWYEHLCHEHGDDADGLQEQALFDVVQNPNWDGQTSPEIKASLTTYLRKTHAEQALVVLKQEWTLTNGESFYLLADPELRLFFGETIGKIARSHWQDVSELQSSMPASLGAPASLPANWHVDPLKLACLLRVADAAQVDSRRADALHTPHRNPVGESKTHWVFQERMLRPILQEDRLLYTAGRAFGPEDAEAWWLAFDTVGMIHRELQGVDSLAADLGRPRFRARGVIGAEDSKRFAQHVTAVGWTPVDVRPHIVDTLGIIGTLGGSALYGQRDDVPIREVLANALDATRIRKVVQGHEHVPAVSVKFSRTDGTDYVSIRDYGIGMSPQDISNYLVAFGQSGWRSADLKRQYPGAAPQAYTSTGRYGIGFFSCFMIADEVRVTTRPLNAAWDQTHILEFREGIDARPVMRPAQSEEYFRDSGTEIRLKLKYRTDSMGGLFFEEDRVSPESQVAWFRHLALTADHAIAVQVLGVEAATLAIDGSDWRERGAGEIFDSLHDAPWLELDAATKDLGRSYFEESLTPLRSSSGDVLGRVAFNVQGDRREWLRAAATYCGGFESGSVPSMVGILSGSPARASRDVVSLDVDRAELVRWVHDQWTRFQSGSEKSLYERLQFQWLANGFGVTIPDLPICLGRNGFLTIADVEEKLKDLDQVALVPLSVHSVLDLGDQGFWIHDYSELCRIPEGALVVGYGARSILDEFPIPSQDDVLLDGDMDWGDEELFWARRHYRPEGGAFRAIARAWACSVRDLISSAESANLTPQADRRIAVETYSGRPVRVSGTIANRPK